MKTRSMIIAATLLACLALSYVLLSRHAWKGREKEVISWREDFDLSSLDGRSAIPKGWTIKGKPGTKKATFSVIRDKKDDLSCLHAEADRASGALLCQRRDVNLEKTPILRWRWRAAVLPKGADGAVAKKDDQAIGIYVGSGSMVRKESVSYRWDTDTPKGTEGECAYGAGSIKVKWFTLRNKEDCGNGQWFIEERNCAKDFVDAWGYCPDAFYLSVSCNSQYTGTDAEADLDWIEFVSLPEDNPTKPKK